MNLHHVDLDAPGEFAATMTCGAVNVDGFYGWDQVTCPACLNLRDRPVTPRPAVAVTACCADPLCPCATKPGWGPYHTATTLGLVDAE